MRDWEKRALIQVIRTATLRLRWATAADRLMDAVREAARREVRYNFDPSQPRLPRGMPGGGQWTDGGTNGGGLPAGTGGALGGGRRPTPVPQGPRFAQARGGGRGPRSVLVDVGGGRFVEGTPSQQARFDVARVWANWQIARVRSVDPRWRPQPGLSSTVEGAILQQQSVLRQGEAHLRSLQRGIGDNGGPPLELPPALPLRSAQEILMPGGRVLGYRFSGARPNIYTTSQSDFDAALLLLTNGRREIFPPDSYPGVYYELPDRCVIGVRNSLRNGMTIDIIEPGTSLLLDPNVKFHRR